MQRLAALPVLLVAAPAFAHPGHVAEAAGHSHFLALGAFAAALGIAAYAVARSVFRRRKAVLSD
jgi:hypothetical protein